MSEIEKMYDNANVKKDWNPTPYGGVKEYYPPFTAEKQLKICKLLLKLEPVLSSFTDTKEFIRVIDSLEDSNHNLTKKLVINLENE